MMQSVDEGLSVSNKKGWEPFICSTHSLMLALAGPAGQYVCDYWLHSAEDYSWRETMVQSEEELS